MVKPQFFKVPRPSASPQPAPHIDGKSYSSRPYCNQHPSWQWRCGHGTSIELRSVKKHFYFYLLHFIYVLSIFKYFYFYLLHFIYLFLSRFIYVYHYLLHFIYVYLPFIYFSSIYFHLFLFWSTSVYLFYSMFIDLCLSINLLCLLSISIYFFLLQDDSL